MERSGDYAAPEPEAFSSERAPPAETRAALVERLVGMEPIERDLAVKQACAANPGLRRATLRREVEARQRQDRALVRAAQQAAAVPGPDGVTWPFGARMEADGLWLDRGERASPVWLCRPFEVLGEGRDAEGGNWALLLGWRDADGRVHAWPMPQRLVASRPGELEAELLARGLKVNADPEARGLLRGVLSRAYATGRARLVEGPGWHGGAYVLGDGTMIGQATERLILSGPGAADAAVVRGHIEGWRSEVAALASGNPVALFAISAAFAAPLLEKAGMEGGGFHLFGPSKTGKSAALRAGLSVWNDPTSPRTWRATANGLEAACADARDGLLPLDEIHQADPRDVLANIYGIANGGGRSRMAREGGARNRATWRCLVLSTGELSVPDMVAKGGETLTPGAAARLPSVPMPPGEAWPAWHGHRTRDGFMEAFHAAGRRHHGAAGRAFLEALTGADPGMVRDAVAAGKTHFLAALPNAADAQVRHVAHAFALVAAAGELARAFGVVPWARGEATAATRTLFEGWLGHRGGVGAAEEALDLARLRAFLGRHGSSRFETLGAGAATRGTANRAGWREEGENGWCYYLTPQAWAETFEGHDPRAAAQRLARRGVIRTDGQHLSVKKTIPGEGRPRLYEVRPGIMGEVED